MGLTNTWKSIAASLVALFLVLPLGAAADQVDQAGSATQMQNLESRLLALEDELKATRSALEQSEEMRREVTPASVEAGSGLDSFMSGLQIGGYVEASYLYNFNNPDNGTGGDPTGGAGSVVGSGTQPLNQFNRNHNTFELDAFKFELGKPAAEPGSAGFQVDLLFGANNHLLCGEGVISESGGGFSSISENADDGVCIQEAYVSYNWEGTEIMFGKWETLLGYEVIDAPYNNHVTHGILFTWAIPLVHNGVLVKGNLTEQIGWAAGLTNGFNNITDNGDNKGALAQLSFEDGPFFASLQGFYGAEEYQPSSTGAPLTNRPDDSRDLMILDLVLTYDASDDLGLWLNADYGEVERSSTTVTGPSCCGLAPSNHEDPSWWGVAGGFTYAINEKVSFAGRGEYFFDDGGSRLYSALGTTSRSETRVSSGTATLTYALTSNLSARLEYRHDHISGQADRPFPQHGASCSTSAPSGDCSASIDTGIVEVSYQFD